MIFDLIRKRNGNWKDDTLSGLTVALALVPEAIAFSFIAGVNPLVGCGRRFSWDSSLLRRGDVRV